MEELIVMLRESRTRDAPSYGGGLTNHLPMCLIALASLGASRERVRAFAAVYERMLEPLTDESAAFVDRARGLCADLRARGRDAVLREELRDLAPDIAGAAFHGAIRTAYATMLDPRLDEDEELAWALAYWQGNRLRLGADAPVGATRGTMEVSEVVDHLRSRGLSRPRGPTISDRLRAVSNDERFVEVARSVRVHERNAVDMLAQVSMHGARTLFVADDFVSLHVLTGAHAVRVLSRWMDEDTTVRAVHALTVAALACFVASGSPARTEARGAAHAEWSEIVARALAPGRTPSPDASALGMPNSVFEDDHLAKLVVSCRDEERAVGDRIYRIVATKVARREAR